VAVFQREKGVIRMIHIGKPTSCDDVHIWLENDDDEVVVKSSKNGCVQIEGRFYPHGKKYFLDTANFRKEV
jgi:hypothetical protein